MNGKTGECPSLLGPPSNLRVVSTSTHIVGLSWKEVVGASRYRVEYAAEPSGTSTEVWQVFSDSATTTVVLVVDLECSETYRFRVSSAGDGVNSSSDFGPSTTMLVRGTTVECLSPPTGYDYGDGQTFEVNYVLPRAGSYRVIVSWHESEGSDGSSTVKREVVRSVPIPDTDEYPFSGSVRVDGLEPENSPFTVALQMCNDSSERHCGASSLNTGGISLPIPQIVLTAPASPKIGLGSTSTLRVLASNLSRRATYSVEMSANAPAVGFESSCAESADTKIILLTFGAVSESNEVPLWACGGGSAEVSAKLRWLRVSGDTKIYAASPVSILVLEPVEVPERPSVAVQKGQVALDWSDVAGASQYQVRYKNLGDLEWLELATTTASEQTVSDLSTSTYLFEVRAHGNGLTHILAWSAWSEKIEASAGGPIGAPTLSVATTTPISIDVSWSTLVGAGSYELQYKQDTSTSAWADVSGSSSTEALRRRIDGLEHDTPYLLRVRALGDGNLYAHDEPGPWSPSMSVRTFCPRLCRADSASGSCN